MEPQVRYVRSADGTRLAMWVLGEGRPMVNPQHFGWFTSMASFWNVPLEREGIGRVAERRMVVRFDGRGTGLSERQVNDFSLQARLADLAAVIAHTGAGPVDIVAAGNAGIVAIAFAAGNPDKVRRLALWNAVTRGRDWKADPRSAAIRGLLDVDWESWVRAQSVLQFGWNEVGLSIGEASIHNIERETFLNASRAARDYDASALLSSVSCPTLVMYSKTNPNLSLEVSKLMAASIPDARLVVFDEPYLLTFGGTGRQIIDQFLDEEAASATTTASSGTAVILFADIVDSTALTERMGDAAFRTKARALDDALRSIIRDNGGVAIDGKLLGDGVLATFPAASQAIDAALRCAVAGNDGGLPLHLGIHAGDVIREQNNVFGGAVNSASRISGLSAPGEVLVSDIVRGLARTSADVSFEDRGEHLFKGIAEPQRIYAVRRNA